MNRRAFLSLIATGLAATTDPERLLWQPGRKLISIPKPCLVEARVLAINGWMEAINDGCVGNWSISRTGWR